jgi:hypothetical protein
MGNQVQIDASLLQNMVSYIGAAGTALDKVAKDREQAKQAAPAVVEALVSRGLLAEERKEAAVSALAESHMRSLDALQKTAAHVKKEAAPPPSMGEAADAIDKKASSGDDARGEADRKFLAALGF